MIKHVLMIAVATTALSGAAFAADLRGPLREPVFVPPPQPIYAGYAWSGPYVGLNVGDGGGSAHYAYSGSADPTYFSGEDGQRNNGVVGGAQIGYNYAFNNCLFAGGGLVLGAEADFDGSAIGGSAVLDSPYIYARVGSSLNYFGTVRGRLGVTFDRVMLFATGGFAYGKVSTDVKAPDDQIYDHASQMHTGYVIGGGFEYAVTNNILLRAEYLRLDLAGKTTAGGDAWMAYTLHDHPVENIVRAGVDYKFDLFGPTARPVIARY